MLEINTPGANGGDYPQPTATRGVRDQKLHGNWYFIFKGIVSCSSWQLTIHGLALVHSAATSVYVRLWACPLIFCLLFYEPLCAPLMLVHIILERFAFMRVALSLGTSPTNTPAKRLLPLSSSAADYANKYSSHSQFIPSIALIESYR